MKTQNFDDLHLPCGGALCASRRILDRYVISKFAMPFMYCFLGFLAICFIFDLADNLQDFMEGEAA